MATKDNQLQIILKEQGVNQDNATAIVKAFGGPFEEAGAILADYTFDDEGKMIITDNTIVVTDEAETDLMSAAREKRLALKKARTTVENNRKALKEDIVKQGNAIDSIARFVKKTIQPAEEYLEQQEKFAELKAAERAAVLRAERIERLSPLVGDIFMYNFEAMTDEQFEELITERQAAHKAIEEAKAKEVAEQAAREKAAAEEQERIRAENAKLKKEAEAREAEIAKQRAVEEKRLAAERAETQRKFDETNAAIVAERKKREAVEAEQRAEQERIAQEKAKTEEVERQALLAPDKEKLVAFNAALETIRTQKLPAVRTKQAQDIVNDIDQMLTKMQSYITSNAERL